MDPLGEIEDETEGLADVDTDGLVEGLLEADIEGLTDLLELGDID